ncbi:MAG TPA: 30S ribosomal protein S16 [Actinomycetota bacterium]|nr:30S ribosomal protein S16 [Actinomycetota bacterium]
MVKIRLMRVGKRKQPSYRVVVADARSPRDGRIIEAIGHYHPREEPSLVEIDNDRALYWLRNGARASDSVRQLLRISGAWSEFSGEAPLAAAQAAAPPADVARKKATPAASVTAAEEAPEETLEANAGGDVAGAADDAADASESPAEAATTAAPAEEEATS